MLINMSFIAQNLFNTNKIFTLLVLILTLSGQIFELLFYVNKTNRILSNYLNAIKDKDFSLSSNIEIVDQSFHSLNESFKNIAKTILDSKIEKEAQFQLLNAVIDKVNSGIILIDSNQNISLINNAAIQNLNLTKYESITDIKNQNFEFFTEITKYSKPSKRNIEIEINKELRHLLIYTNPIRLINNSSILVTFNDIKEELEKKEIQSWQKLLRTLGHEIMNSVTPISSLTETSLFQIQNNNGNLKSISELNIHTLEKIQKALKTIEKRSIGLYNFVDDFRKLAKIPEPVKAEFQVKDIFETVIQLLKPELKRDSIDICSSINPVNLIIKADCSLIEQVLINLIKNASEALLNCNTPTISLNAVLVNDMVQIKVKDNGPGISTEVLDNIFIPFFTTKEKGSGIGLSLSRQIMLLHGGNISVKSEPSIETVFTLQF